MAGPAKTRLASIEVLRGVAASAVVLSHAARHVDKAQGAPLLVALFAAGHAGVDLFFVISGFIILHVHRGDIGAPGRLGRYATRRASRVLPLYWIALAITVAMAALGTHHMPDAATLLWSAALLPTRHDPLLGIAWTLEYEMVFYAVFAVLIAERRAGIALCLAWLGLIAATMAGAGIPDLPTPLCGVYCLEFFAGMAAAGLAPHLGRASARAVAMAGVAGFVAALVAESLGCLDGLGVAARVAYGLPAAALVAGLAAAEARRSITLPPFLAMLGGASYAIYLFQFVFIGAVWQALRLTASDVRLPNTVLFALLASAALGGGVLTSRLVERPLLRALRRPARPASPQRA